MEPKGDDAAVAGGRSGVLRQSTGGPADRPYTGADLRLRLEFGLSRGAARRPMPASYDLALCEPAESAAGRSGVQRVYRDAVLHRGRHLLASPRHAVGRPPVARAR